MVDYSQLASTAQRLIGSFGHNCIVSRTVDGVYDPEENEQVSTSTAYSVKGVKLNFSTSNVDNEIIKQGDSKFLIEAKNLPITPTENDKIIILGTTWNIISINTIQPASEVVYYELHLRK